MNADTEVHITTDDVQAIFATDRRTVPVIVKGIVTGTRVLQAVPEETIAGMTPEQRDLMRMFLQQQAARY